MADQSARSFESWAARWQERSGQGSQNSDSLRQDEAERPLDIEAVAEQGGTSQRPPDAIERPALFPDMPACLECGGIHVHPEQCVRFREPEPDEPEERTGTPEDFERWLARQSATPQVVPQADGGIYINGAALLAVRDEQPLDLAALAAQEIPVPAGWKVAGELSDEDRTTDRDTIINRLDRELCSARDRVQSLTGDRDIYLAQWQQEQAVTREQAKKIAELRSEIARLESVCGRVREQRSVALRGREQAGETEKSLRGRIARLEQENESLRHDLTQRPAGRKARPVLPSDTRAMTGGAMYGGGCAGCRIHIEKTQPAYWSRAERKLFCEDCGRP